jgi:Domain of unknown function (DUF4136)
MARKSTAAALMTRAKARLTSLLSVSQCDSKYGWVRLLVFGMAYREMWQSSSCSQGNTGITLNRIKGGVMKLRKAVFVVVVCVFFAASRSFAQQVKTDYDRDANFAQYKIYTWEKVQTPNPLLVERIKAAVNAALAAKGWTQVESSGDISIVAVAMTRDQQTLNTFYDGFGGGWRWRGFGGFGESTTTVNTYKVGTLVVDLFETNTKNLVWRGVSSETLSDKSDKNIKNLNKGVQKMFQHFPPEPPKK